MMAQAMFATIGLGNLTIAAWLTGYAAESFDPLAMLGAGLCFGGAYLALLACEAVCPDILDESMLGDFPAVPEQAAADHRGAGSRPPKQCHIAHDGEDNSR